MELNKICAVLSFIRSHFCDSSYALKRFENWISRKLS